MNTVTFSDGVKRKVFCSNIEKQRKMGAALHRSPACRGHGDCLERGGVTVYSLGVGITDNKPY